MNKLKASVIVPTYNRKKLLNYTLDVKPQTLPIIITNKTAN